MSAKTLKKLPKFLEDVAPSNVADYSELVAKFRHQDIGANTLCAALPVSRGAWVALRYEDHELKHGILLDKQSPRQVTDHLFALRPPMTLPSQYGKNLEVLGINSWPIYVLVQLTLDKVNIPVIRERLPKIKTEAALGAHYFKSDSPNLRLSAMFRIHAHDVFANVGETPVRINVPAKTLESHLTSLGFFTVTSGWGERVNLVPAKAMKTAWLAEQLKTYGKSNDRFKVGGLRIVSAFPSESVYGTTLWRTPKD